ncbi:hypothetical protein Cgig2_013510 [Carnegiea gigantea]|uniref:Lachrymatory factor synthase n=1 Tax=Carnegiea gigantea TaxID=171969 RepID=A0A9Q1JG88_9CARY|nr:hypothetical protein Cgig2_013510 [Carnegiea gigantea]
MQEAEKWQGKVTTTLANTQPHQIWPLFKDFFILYKYFPSLSYSCGIHGTNGEPGCIRYCLGSSIPPSKGSDHDDYQKIMDGGDEIMIISWSKERLVAVDEEKMDLSYEIVESNIGFNSYVSTVRISPDQDNHGCVIEWGFTVDPVQGLRFEDLVNKYEVGLQRIAKKMEDYWEIRMKEWDGVRMSQPGVVRYCASMDGNQWAKERLLMIDPSDMCFSYEIVDNNAGFKSYVSTVRLDPIDGDDGGRGCRIVWSFVADPVEGLTLQRLLGFFDTTAKAMARRMQEALCASKSKGKRVN